MELLSGFEPETSSLPTDWEDEVFCFPGLLCPFWSGVSSFPALLRPLLPSARFPVWVAVWVRATGIVGVGQLSLAVEWSHFALLETMKGYQNEEIEPPGGTLPPGGPVTSGYVSRMGGKCGSCGESGEGVLGNTGVLLLLFRPSDKGHCLDKKRSFLLLRNSGCQITGKYQTELRVGHTILGGQ